MTGESKRIVFFIQNFSRPAGSERVVSVIANGLSRAGHQVSVLSICGPNTCFYELDDDISLHTLIHADEVDNRKQALKVLSALRSFYATHPTDIVVDVFAGLSLYTLALKRRFGYKSVTWEHFNFSANVGMNKLGRRMAGRWADCIVTLTHEDARQYEAGLKTLRCPVVCIPNPSPYQNIDPAPLNAKVALSVGRLTSQKGFDRMLCAWRLVEDEVCDWELRIVGEGEERESLEQAVRELDLHHVTLPGTSDDMPCVYRGASMYLSTARFEGLPMTMIEAQSFGLPILTFDYLTGPREMVEGNNSGVIVHGDEQAQIAGLAHAIINCSKDRARLVRMGESAVRARTRFAVAPIVEQWKDLLARLC